MGLGYGMGHLTLELETGNVATSVQVHLTGLKPSLSYYALILCPDSCYLGNLHVSLKKQH